MCYQIQVPQQYLTSLPLFRLECFLRLHAQQHGEALQFHWRRWESFKLPFSCNAEARSAVGDAGAVCRTLSRLLDFHLVERIDERKDTLNVHGVISWGLPG